MNHHLIRLALCLAAAAATFPANAGEHRKDSRGNRHQSSYMRAIAVAPKSGEPGHGWQYFTDARRSRAVVISPKGDYYFSDGEGLNLVFKADRAA